LLDVEHVIIAKEGNLLRLAFTLFVLDVEKLPENNQFGFLAFLDVPAKLGRLLVGEPVGRAILAAS
jgi:hypothetical protein